jgi:hypothetical protein
MSQKERSYWECAIKLSTKPSKPKNRTWIFPKTKDEENWWHDYTKKKLTQEETKFWSKTYVHFNFSCILVLWVLWVYVKVVWFASVEYIYLVLCVLWVYMKVVWYASVWTYFSSEWSSMKNISFRKHSTTIKQKQLSENIFSSFIGIYKNG